MNRTRRKELIEAIEKKRGSKLVCYVTSDRANCATQISGDVIPIIHDHILSFPEESRSKLDLFIYSRGGQADVPWTLVSMFRQYCHKGSFSVLVPFRAHSAATVICLGADEIIMSKKGELGPIDATMSSGPFNPTEKNSNARLPVAVEDVNGYFALLERLGCARPTEKMEGFKQLTQNIHPLALGSVNRLFEETKLVALRLLGTRAKPFLEEENQDIIKKLSSELYSHNHAINRTEAVRHLGLKHVKNAEDESLDKEMWELFTEYRKYLQLDEPFLPDQYLLANDKEEHLWDDMPYAIIESSSFANVCKRSVKVKKQREVPPQLNITLKDINFPPISFNTPNPMPDQQKLLDLFKQTVNISVQQAINVAIKKSIEELLQRLPIKAFEHITYNAGWKKE